MVLSRLDEQQRRWLAAIAANRIGHGGVTQVALITGLDAKTIKLGQDELATDLAEHPVERVQVEDGGRKLSEKKNQP